MKQERTFSVQTYTVYEQRVAPEDIEERAGRLVFVKEGFAFWALIFPGLWFLVNRLWRGFFLYLGLSIALAAALTLLGAGEQSIAWAGAALNLIFAFEARDIYRASLERQGYVMKGIVSGRNLVESERRFLMEWLPAARQERERMTAMASTGGPVTGDAPRGSVPVIGMFPAHGG
jgi:hypothetical protein